MAEVVAVGVEVEVEAEEVAEAEDLHRPVASPLGLPTFASVEEEGTVAAAQ